MCRDLTLHGYSAHDHQSKIKSTGGNIMASGTGLLVIWTDIAAEHEADFNAWYDQEHIPQLLGVPGFQTGRRYQAVEGAPKYVAIYQLADENVLKSDAFRAVRESPTAWTKKITPHFRNTQRGVFRQIFSHGTPPQKDAEFALTVRLNTPADHEKEFNDWYNEDHIPALVGVPGVYCARRYEAVEGDPRYLAVYEMRDGAATKSPEWETARNYGRTAQVRPYLKDLKAVVAKRIFPA
jgi:antibiotic biosynthesis monooxygenase (ABM) superfamily enzyme